MSNWSFTRLGDLLRPSNERSTRNDQFPVLTSSRSGLHLQSEYFNRVVASKDNTGYKVIRKGQFTYRAMSDDGFFRFNRLSKQEAGIISPAYEVFECNTNKADPVFMDYLMNSGIVLSQIYGAAQGGTRLSLRFSTLSEFEVNIPPLPEQKKIAEIIFEIDQKNSKLVTRINALSRVRIQLVRRFVTQGIHGATDDKKDLPEGWGEKTLGEVSAFRRGSFPQPYGNPEWFDDAGYPFVQVYDIDDNGKLKPNTKTRISKAAADKSVFIPSGSLLVSLQGSIGRVAITQYDAYVDRTILIFTNYEEDLTREYFALLIGDLFSRKGDVADGGVIKTITKQTLKDFSIPIPPLDEQQKMSEVVSSIDNAISLYEKQLFKSDLLKKSLSADLLSGRKRVSV